MSNKQKILFTFGSLFLVMFFIVVTMLKSPGGPLTPSSPATPTPTSTTFSLVNIYPASGKIASTIPNLAVIFTFSHEIDPSSIKITIDPEIGFYHTIGEYGKKLNIRPAENWEYYKTYTISVSLKSKEGQELSPITHSFTPTELKGSGMTEQYRN